MNYERFGWLTHTFNGTAFEEWRFHWEQRQRNTCSVFDVLWMIYGGQLSKEWAEKNIALLDEWLRALAVIDLTVKTEVYDPDTREYRGWTEERMRENRRGWVGRLGNIEKERVKQEGYLEVVKAEVLEDVRREWDMIIERYGMHIYRSQCLWQTVDYKPDWMS